MSTRVHAILRAPRFSLSCSTWTRRLHLDLRLHLLNGVSLSHQVRGHANGRLLGRAQLPELTYEYTVGPMSLYTPATPTWPHERMETWLDQLGFDGLSASVLSHEFQDVMAPHSSLLTGLARAWHPDPVGWEARLRRAAQARDWAFKMGDDR